MATEVNISAEGKDKLGDIVIARLRRGYERQQSYIQHQGRSVAFLKRRAEAQYNREYLPEDVAHMREAFGICPTRYYGVTQQKTNATHNWKIDLVLNQLDALAVCVPTPDPDIDKAAKDRIRFQLIQKLQEQAGAAGIVDLDLLMNPRGGLDPRVKAFLEEAALGLKEWEQAKKVQAAKRGATKMQRKIRDMLVEGDFRQAYFSMSFDQALHGVGIMRFPTWTMMPGVEHSGESGIVQKWKKVPMFKHVSVHDFFPLDDAPNLQTNTGNTELTNITKAQLIACAKNSEYNRDNISNIVEEYQFKNRNWLWQVDTDRNEDAPMAWDTDEPIQLVIHEGFFSGKELAEFGITQGVDPMEYVNARVEVCGGDTIKGSPIQAPHGGGRTYFCAPFVKTGTNIFDTIGLAAMLWDTEQRVNVMLHQFEYNMDWAARPANMVNKSAFKNPVDADNVIPGANYAVDDRWGASGSIPEPIRTMRGPSAQYHLIMTQIAAFLRMADEDCGIPAFAYSSQDYGKSSLGEYTQRMTGALRTVKGMTIQEDLHLIEPMFEILGRQLMIDDPELREEQDINLQVRGMTGLLKEDIASQRQAEVLPMLMSLKQSGMSDTEPALQFAVRQMLDQAGFPVDALGMSDPAMDNAIAVAAGQPMTGAAAASQQVPQLDGRSRVPANNVAQPNGMSNLNQTGPIQ